MGLGIFVRSSSKLHDLLPKHTFDKSLFTQGCDFCSLGKEMAKVAEPDLLDETSVVNKSTRKMMRNNREYRGHCHFTFFDRAGRWIGDYTDYVGYHIKEENSPEETKELLNRLLKISRKKVEELAKKNKDILFAFDYFVKWLKLLAKHKVGFAASY